MFRQLKTFQNTWKLKQQFHAKCMDEHSYVRGFWFWEKVNTPDKPILAG